MYGKYISHLELFLDSVVGKHQSSGTRQGTPFGMLRENTVALLNRNLNLTSPWWATVHRVTKSRTWLSNLIFSFFLSLGLFNNCHLYPTGFHHFLPIWHDYNQVPCFQCVTIFTKISFASFDWIIVLMNHTLPFLEAI